MALEDIDLSVVRGECFGILGENGAGKSTLFRILATLVRPDAGTARIGGLDVVRDGVGVRRLLAPVTASERSLYWRVSAEENLRLYAALYGLEPPVAAERIREVLELLGLAEAGRKQVGLFSSGMKQRLLLGRALLGRPEVLLLDEPTRSLDPVSARDFRSFLRREVRDTRQTTILLATHDHAEVTDLCDRVAVLDRGRVVAVGPTETLLSASRTRLCSLWTPAPPHEALERSLASAGARVLEISPFTLSDDGEWCRVRLEIDGGEMDAAHLLAVLTAAGIPVSRFIRDDLSLADLLERVSSPRPTQEARSE
jgi:ABC-type multidrug transport system ATPase subunit